MSPASEHLLNEYSKLLTQVPNVALNCQPSGNIGSAITADPTHDAQDGGLNLSNTVTDALGSSLSSACVPYVYAKAWGTGTTPNDQITAMRVSIRSEALAYNSVRAKRPPKQNSNRTLPASVLALSCNRSNS